MRYEYQKEFLEIISGNRVEINKRRWSGKNEYYKWMNIYEKLWNYYNGNGE